MSIEDQFRIGDLAGGPAGIGGVKPGGPAAGGGDGAEFRRLLEKLEDVARGQATEPTEGVQDLQSLRSALDKADDEFASVMQLREQLEEAYRSRQS